MVQLTLPKNSQVTQGQSWPAPTSPKGEVKEFRIYRWNPDDKANPRIDTYSVDMGDCGPMVLDALIKIKNEHSLGTGSKSCRYARLARNVEH